METAAEATVAGEASSSVAGTAAAEETAPAEKKKSWFSFLNPFASSEETEPAKAGPDETKSAKAVVEGVDETLGTKGSSAGRRAQTAGEQPSAGGEGNGSDSR